MSAHVVAVSRDETHRFSKLPCEAITLVAGMGVAGDAHAGTLVQHRSRVRRDPNQPNLLGLPADARLLIGAAVLRVSGLRNPCRQINDYSAGLLKVVVARIDGRTSISDVTLGATGGAESLDGVGIVRKAGVMAVVERGSDVRPGMPVDVVLPDEPHRPLTPV
jgi:hypothetical protein